MLRHHHHPVPRLVRPLRDLRLQGLHPRGRLLQDPRLRSLLSFTGAWRPLRTVYKNNQDPRTADAAKAKCLGIPTKEISVTVGPQGLIKGIATLRVRSPKVVNQDPCNHPRVLRTGDVHEGIPWTQPDVPDGRDIQEAVRIERRRLDVRTARQDRGRHDGTHLTQ